MPPSADRDASAIGNANADDLALGRHELREALEEATEDEDWEVRVYAVEALKRIPAGGR